MIIMMTKTESPTTVFLDMFRDAKEPTFGGKWMKGSHGYGSKMMVSMDPKLYAFSNVNQGPSVHVTFSQLASCELVLGLELVTAVKGALWHSSLPLRNQPCCWEQTS